MKKIITLWALSLVFFVSPRSHYWRPRLGIPGSFMMTSGDRAGWQRMEILRGDNGRSFFADLKYHHSGEDQYGFFDYYDIRDVGGCGGLYQSIGTAVSETDPNNVASGICEALGYQRAGATYPYYLRCARYLK